MAAWKETDTATAEVKPKNKVAKQDMTNVLSMFKPAIDIPAVKCLRCGIYGAPKSGKTHWALTAKRPLYILDTEKSVPLLVKQLPIDLQKDVYIVDLVDYAEKKGQHMDVVKSMEAAFDIIGQLIDAVSESETTGSICVDSMSDLYDYLKSWLSESVDESKKFGDTIMGFEYGKLNKRWTQFMRLLQASDWNIILTFKAKQRYDGMKPTGIFDPDWQKNTFYWLDLVMEVKKEFDDHRFVFKGGRFGDTYEDIINPTFDEVRNYLTKKSGVVFE